MVPEMGNCYGESAYEDSYRIYTPSPSKVQQAVRGRRALRNNVLDYDMPRRYRGPANAAESGRMARITASSYADGAADHQRQSSGSDLRG